MAEKPTREPMTAEEHHENLRKNFFVQVYMHHLPTVGEKVLHGTTHLDNANKAAKMAVGHFDKHHAPPK